MIILPAITAPITGLVIALTIMAALFKEERANKVRISTPVWWLLTICMKLKHLSNENGLSKLL